MEHPWFREDPLPTQKFVHPQLYVCTSELLMASSSVFEGLTSHQTPPQRRVTQDDAPNSMMPVPAAPPALSTTASFASLSVGGVASTHGPRKKARLG